MAQLNEIRGRLALITGASGGIGAACARQLAERGVHLALTYSSNLTAITALKDELQSTSPDLRISIYKVDVASAEEIQHMFIQIDAYHGQRPDILVSNAGYGKRVPQVWDITLEEFDYTINVNLRASFVLVKGVVEHMRNQRWGRIIFMSSIAASGGGINGCHYAASKGGMTGMMKNLATRLAEFNISVNDVAPAMIGDTGMIPNAQAIPEVAAGIPIGRLGVPEEVANVVTMLATTGYMTGQSLLLAGGLNFRELQIAATDISIQPQNQVQSEPQPLAQETIITTPYQQEQSKPGPLEYCCPFCSTGVSIRPPCVARLRRHIFESHFRQYNYYCAEPNCPDAIARIPFKRKDVMAEHYNGKHGKRLSSEEWKQILQEEPQPEICAVCHAAVSSWDDFRKCVDKCVLMLLQNGIDDNAALLRTSHAQESGPQPHLKSHGSGSLVGTGSDCPHLCPSKDVISQKESQIQDLRMQCILLEQEIKRLAVTRMARAATGTDSSCAFGIGKED
ncbi:SDR family NAD(P)-dependent oxidoreductase [Aspergillus mulundensis]|uniref:C2H2-type domain-containing protein n=1 Tax=Aspergillus mulundensis TaxID=1810919 RepID=A0A3D8SUM1_9EURO|nr:hypothetical protein DSM5745_01797 [Aspergillus mulundensis]RDW90022.1 hypothetical protein DSM5745_01797 [Aspergillus mulundensis]